jgi:hypothetical protein
LLNLFLIFSVTTAAQICPDLALDRPLPAATTVIRIVLEPRDLPDTSSIPLVGEGPERFLQVRGRVIAVEHGPFSVRPGASIRLAIHSIATSFGYDSVGEEFLVGLDQRRQVEWVTPDPVQLVRIRGTVVTVSRQATSETLKLVDKPALFARIKISSIANGAGTFRSGDVVVLGLPGQVVSGGSYCLILIARTSAASRPFRLLRLMRSKTG